MNSHALRLKLLVGLTVAFAAAALTLFVLGMWSDAASGVFGAALGLLVPAVIDATQVERRRRKPGVKAVSDDLP
jgi:uncharacterized membrane protein YjjP (DUF1212 family)